MGDAARFREFATFIECNFTERNRRIVDVAAGKGHLKAALYQLGYRRVTCWDVRHRMAKPRPGLRFQRFDWKLAPAEYDLVAAMHPDEATDHAILYAARHRVPFVVCPCCLKPSASKFAGRTKGQWIEHLERLAREGDMQVQRAYLPIKGDNLVLFGWANA